jgi:hypothetical protein
MTAEPRESLARHALLFNAIFSTLTGATLLIAAGPLGVAVGLEDPLALRIVGAALVPFAAILIILARARTLRARRIVAISVMDGSWVLATLGLAWVWPTLFHPTGWALAMAVAIVVAGSAAGQIAGVIRMRGGEKRFAARGLSLIPRKGQAA